MLKYKIVPLCDFVGLQNCTIFWCSKTQKGVVIDPGGDVAMILDAIKEHDLGIEKILLTHGHFDHVGGAMDLAAALSVPIVGPHKDDEFITTEVEAAQKMYDLSGGKDVTGNTWLNDGDEVTFGNITLGVIHTPGHTPGHIVFYNQDAGVAQVGDVLFKGSIGRTDFPRGDLATLENSITQKLWPLGNNMTFIPGHGPTSTFGIERATNPFVGDGALKA